MVAFVGPNGSGKTTAIRHMLGLYRPDAGIVRVFGCDPLTSMHVIGPRMGVMLDQPGLSEELTSREYLEFFGGLFGLARRPAMERTVTVLDMVGLAKEGDRRLNTFSKGMRQRIALARCILNRPELLILDEPFDGIDNESRRELIQLLPRMARENSTAAFLTSHNLHDIDRVSTRVAIINRGRIIALDSPRALRQRQTAVVQMVIIVGPDSIGIDVQVLVPGSDYCQETRELKVQLNDSGHDRDSVTRLLVESGISIESLRTTESTLEDVYFALIDQDNAQCSG